MQYFKDTSTGKLWAYNDDVQVSQDDKGVYRFKTRHGFDVTSAPETLVPFDPFKQPFAPEKAPGYLSNLWYAIKGRK